MKNRNIKLDNIKGILIFLVVFGHILEINNGWYSEPNRLLLNFIYSFHMPAFSLAAGITSTRKNIKKRVSNLFFFYIIFNIFYSLPLLLKGNFTYYNLFVPQQGLWFLSALIVWTFLIPIIEKFNQIFILLFLIIFSVTINLFDFDGYILSVIRTITFFPFFVAGYFYKNKFLNLKLNKYLAVVFILCVIGIYYLNISDKWFLGSYTYFQIEFSAYIGMSIKLFFYIIGFIGCYLIFAYTTARMGMLTRFGINSLSIYVLQFIFTKYFLKINLLSHMNNYLVIILYVVIAMLICFLMSTKLVSKVVLILYKIPERFIK